MQERVLLQNRNLTRGIFLPRSFADKKSDTTYYMVCCPPLCRSKDEGWEMGGWIGNTDQEAIDALVDTINKDGRQIKAHLYKCIEKREGRFVMPSFERKLIFEI